MKSIRDVIKRFEQPEGKRMSAEEMVEALKKHPYVKEFCDRHADVTDDMLVRSITDVYETAKEHDQCAQCPGLGPLSQSGEGTSLDLVFARLVDQIFVPVV